MNSCIYGDKAQLINVTISSGRIPNHCPIEVKYPIIESEKPWSLIIADVGFRLTYFTADISSTCIENVIYQIMRGE